ncbi:MAG: type II CAAX endopeptidase family protein [Verrucomicrobiota bacterium]|nr:type II CAAX endopeptidase family protein [Verrucomicrobiota bacterium]
MVAGKPWRVELVAWLLLGVAASILIGTVIVMGYNSAVLKPDQFENNIFIRFIGMFSINLLILLQVNVFLRWQGITWREAFGFGEGKISRTILLALFVTSLLVPLALGLQKICWMVLESFNNQPVPQPAIQHLQQTVTLVDRIYHAILSIVFAPIVEEVLFRGIFYPCIKFQGHPKLALWGTSLFFALIHGHLPTFLPLTLFALVLTLLYESTGNLLTPILTHSFFNALNFFLVISLPQSS